MVCAVCLCEQGAGGQRTACGHRFHSACLGRWLDQCWSCPTCRSPAIPPRCGAPTDTVVESDVDLRTVHTECSGSGGSVVLRVSLCEGGAVVPELRLRLGASEAFEEVALSGAEEFVPRLQAVYGRRYAADRAGADPEEDDWEGADELVEVADEWLVSVLRGWEVVSLDPPPVQPTLSAATLAMLAAGRKNAAAVAAAAAGHAAAAGLVQAAAAEEVAY